MKKYLLILFAFCFSIQSLNATVYECTYKTKTGFRAVSSFDTLNLSNPNYSVLSTALRSGNCRELYVKKYIIDATSCNVQYYKSNMKIANITCSNNNQAALQKLKNTIK